MSIARIQSVDILRGVTVALMILVNNPGSWTYVYPALLHAHWDGLRLADLVFPAFLFIVGLSVVFSLRVAKSSETARRAVLPKIMKRSALLVLLGLALNVIPEFNLQELRWPGVLQRIGLVFAATALAYLWLTMKQRIVLVTFILLGYWLLLCYLPIPDTGHVSLAVSDNLPAWLDRQLMSGHLWQNTKTWDPEGILSTLPAIATGIIGSLAAELSFSRKPQTQLLMLGIGLMAFGLIWQFYFPFNKALWTSSYVLFTAGATSCIWVLFIAIYDHGKSPYFSLPFLALGANPLLAYAGSELLAKLLFSMQWHGLSWSGHLFAVAQQVWPNQLASLSIGVLMVLFWMVICLQLMRKGIRLKL